MTSSYEGISSSLKNQGVVQQHSYTQEIEEANRSLNQSIQRFNQGVNANDQVRIQNAARAGDDLKALGQLSQTLGSALGAIQKERIARFRSEAQVLKERGINSQEDLDKARAEQDEQEQQLAEQNKKLDEIKANMVKNNEPFAAVDSVSKLNGYHIAELNRLNVKEIASGFSSGLDTFIDTKIQESGDSSREAMRAYVKQYSAQYLDEFGEYSNGLVAKYGLPIIQKEKKERLQAIDAKYEKDRSETIATEATQQLILDGDLGKFMSRVEFTKDAKGNYIGKKGALTLLEKINQRQAKAGTPLNLEAIGESIASNGKPFKTHPRFGYLVDQRDDIIRGNFAEEETARQQALKEVELNFYQAAASREEPFSDAEIEQMQKDFEDDTGMDRSKAPWFSNYRTSNERDQEEDADKLRALRQQRGFLIESDLRGVHPKTYQDFIGFVQEDSAISQAPPNIKTAGNDFVNSTAGSITGETDGVKDKSPKWGIVRDNLRTKYDQLFAENIRQGLNHSKAHADARAQILTEINFEGRGGIPDDVRNRYFSLNPLTSTDRDTAMMIVKGKQYLANPNFDVNTTVIPGTDAEIKALERYNNGTGEIPKFYYDVVRDNKGITAFDLANAQYFAATGNELGKGPREEAYDAADPALQQVLRFRPTRSKIFRTKEDVDYNSTELTVVGQSGFSEIVSIAKASGAKFPELVAAQWALESDYGRMPSGANNFFGMKATAGEGSTTKTTTEYIDGRLVTTDANFKNYGSKEESIGELISRWYQDYEGYSGVNNASSIEEAAQMLVNQGYATDPEYAQKLMRIIRQNS